MHIDTEYAPQKGVFSKISAFLARSVASIPNVSLILAVMALVTWPIAARAELLCLTNNGTITITGYSGPADALDIPTSIGGLPVTKIRQGAFLNNSFVTSVTIPSTITSIGIDAFAGCTNLTDIDVNALNRNYSSIDGVLFDKSRTTLLAFPGGNEGPYTIPASVTSIGEGAFYGCANLVGVSIPGGVTSIGDSGFYECTALATVSIPDSVTQIGDAAFYGCSSLTSAAIPNSVTTIGDGAFSGCASLPAILIPNSVTSIGDETFSYCTSLASVNIPSSITKIGDFAFISCVTLTNITIPNSVTSIGYEAFYGCSGLTSITIPNAITSVGDNAFQGCSGLTSVTIPESVTSIGDYSFSGCTRLTSIVIPKKVTQIGDYAFSDCTGLTGITITNKVTSLGMGAFSGCSSLATITLPNKIKSIGNNTFSGCSSLTNVQISKGVTSIGNYAFSGCTSLAGLKIPSGVKLIGNNAFSGCTELATLTLPGTVTQLGDDAFSGCVGLGKVAMSGSLKTIGNSVFAGCVGLTNITIPRVVTSIGGGTFSGCTSLSAITIPSSVKTVGNGAFSDCTSLAVITIGSGLKSLGDYAFSGCASLRSVALPSSLTVIGDYTFNNCSSLTNVVMSKLVTSIGNYAFAGCVSLKDITLPTHLTRIGSGAFAHCSGLTAMSIPSGVSSVGYLAFSDCPNLTTVVFQGNAPSSVDADVFLDSNNVTVYYLTTMKNWGQNFAGRPTVVLTSPLIVRQPQSQTVLRGAKPAFGVVAYGPGTLTYKWQLNGTNVAGAHSATYTISSAQPKHVGNYTVIVANKYGSVTSSPAMLALMETPAKRAQMASEPGVQNVAGTYRGLVSDSASGIDSGAFTIVVSASGSFTAKISFSDKAASASGRIESGQIASGAFSVRIAGSDANVIFQIDPSGSIAGNVSDAGDGSLVASLSGALVGNSDLGTFNFNLLSGTLESAALAGSGAAVVSKSGVIASVTVGDENAAPLVFVTDRLENGLIPVFATLPGNRGIVSGWLSVAGQQIVSPSPLLWHKPDGSEEWLWVSGTLSGLQENQ